VASIKDLKKRIQSTKNTQQTTKAMKMVSAAYLRRAQDAINNQKPYAKRLGAMLQTFATMDGVVIDSPLVRVEGSEPIHGANKLLLVLVTSDRGLCGGFNAYVMKATQRWIRDHKREYDAIDIAFVGKKGFEFFRNRRLANGPYYQELGGKVNFAKARKLSEALIEEYTSGRYSEVKFVFNEFKNALTQTPVVEAFLPLTPPARGSVHSSQDAHGMVIVRPSASEVLNELLSKHFPMQVFRILLESQAGEHGARMSAMENATKNAGEMIGRLTLDYNKQRQAGITKELLEIISGSESQKAG
jgi:F-type H+-transporting ATPase subunit gamma